MVIVSSDEGYSIKFECDIVCIYDDFEVINVDFYVVCLVCSFQTMIDISMRFFSGFYDDIFLYGFSSLITGFLNDWDYFICYFEELFCCEFIFVWF